MTARDKEHWLWFARGAATALVVTGMWLAYVHLDERISAIVQFIQMMGQR